MGIGKSRGRAESEGTGVYRLVGRLQAGLRLKLRVREREGTRGMGEKGELWGWEGNGDVKGGLWERVGSWGRGGGKEEQG